MPRIFWTPKRKARLLEQSKSLTVKQLARLHFQPVAEIERMLLQLAPDNHMIKKVYREKGVKVIQYYPAYAGGVRQQKMWESRPLTILHVEA